MPKHDRKNQDRDSLAGEHAFTDAGQLILAVLFFVVWILDSFVLQWSTFLNGMIPLHVRLPIAVLVFIPAVYLARASERAIFGQKQAAPHVVRTGAFAFVRHPLYLSEILLYLGILVASMSLATCAVWLLAIAFLHYISRKEEQILISRFGDDYRNYMVEVSMWIPLRRRQ
jgi:protein-S-isoprenylcysteine O-methyltransferase Ste14